MKNVSEQIVVRALQSKQAGDVEVYSFFLHGSDLSRIADITRIGREGGDLKGFQRREIRNHVKSIVEFLDSGAILFPNAIILALSPEIEFKFARGSRPDGMVDVADAGTLTIPVRPAGQRVAWIVDGQQRTLALSRTKNCRLPVPVVAFVSDNLETHREQFILVNKARPLPTRLINELLPEVSVRLPRDLAVRQLPSELCDILNKDRSSPFCGLVRRESDPPESQAIVTDTALIEAIRCNLKAPLGALAQYRQGSEGNDTEAMYKALVVYWSAVRDAFPQAWGKHPTESRLMHSAGIRAMGGLMDPIMLRADSAADPESEVKLSLKRLAPLCRWTHGAWDQLQWRWNEVQSTGQSISKLMDYLVRLDRELARRGQ